MSENSPIISFQKADILNGEATVIYDLDMEVYPSDFVYIAGTTEQTDFTTLLIWAEKVNDFDPCF